jgi:hypothetical protein
MYAQREKWRGQGREEVGDGGVREGRGEGRGGGR